MKNISVSLMIVGLIFLVACKKKNNAINYTINFKVFATNHSITGIKTIKLTNGVYVAAMQESDKMNYCLLIAIDSTGKEVWRHEFTTDLKTISDIQPTSDTGMLISSIDATGQYDCYLTRIAADGHTSWIYDYKILNDSFHINSAVITVTQGNYCNLLLGLSNPADSGYNKLEWLQFSNSGQLLNQNTVNTGTNLIFSTIQMIAQPDGFYVTGFFDNYNDWRNHYKYYTYSFGSFLLKTDLNGVAIWFKKQTTDTIVSNGISSGVTFTGGAICSGNTNNIIQAGILTTINLGLTFPRIFPSTNLGNNVPLNTGTVMVTNFDSQTGNFLNTDTFSLIGLSQRVLLNNTADKGYIVAATDNIDVYKINLLGQKIELLSEAIKGMKYFYILNFNNFSIYKSYNR